MRKTVIFNTAVVLSSVLVLPACSQLSGVSQVIPFGGQQSSQNSASSAVSGVNASGGNDGFSQVFSGVSQVIPFAGQQSSQSSSSNAVKGVQTSDGNGGFSQVSSGASQVMPFSQQSQHSGSPQIPAPAGLKMPAGHVLSSSVQPRHAVAQTNSNDMYYVVVGTYPESAQAMDMFIRLSSIGLKKTTMESRQTKTGQQLHMVRLGPFTNQNEIDRVKNTLAGDGLAKFKVVKG